MNTSRVAASSDGYQPSTSKTSVLTTKPNPTSANPGAGANSSTIVTLSNGQQSTVTERSASTLKATPLTIAWAPQMLVQGDKSGDEQLDLDEFSKQLGAAGVAADAAKKLFDSFDSSSDGKLSVEEYVNGVTQNFNSGDNIFTKLLDTYMHDKDGNSDSAMVDNFLKKGEALAKKYEIAAGLGR